MRVFSFGWTASLSSAFKLFRVAAAGCWLSACGGMAAAHDALAVSARIAAALPIHPAMNFTCIENIPHHRLIKATAVATDAASCADCRMSAEFRPLMLGAISGTTIDSPGLSAELSGLPENH